MSRLLSFSFLAFTLATTAAVALAEDLIPKAFDNSRYELMRAKSPFALATVVTTPAPQASFAANWYISGVARIGDTNFVAIKSRDLTTQFSLYGDESVDGVMLSSVNWSDTIGKSTVILRKGTETARLEFNEAQLRSPAPAATAATGPTPAGGKAPPGGRPAVMNPVNAPRPSPMGVNIPASPNAAQSSNTVPRRRVLPIPVSR